MESFSIWQILSLIVMSAILFTPMIAIIRKAGYSGWWVITQIIPVVNIVFFLIFAFKKWPVQKR